jgi:hypothetical protein
MKNTEKIVRKQTIYNTSVKTKAELREESEKALKKFIRAGGVVEVGRPARVRKGTMSAKSSRGFVSGTGGFATGYPRRSVGA